MNRNEVEQIREYMLGAGKTFMYRDACLFQLGVDLGYRIRELLSLKFGDVYNFKVSAARERVYVDKRYLKGKRAGLGKIILPESRNMINEWYAELVTFQDVSAQTYLIQSRKGENRAISYQQANRILKEAFENMNMDGKLATHTMRKTAAVRFYKASNNDINATKHFLGHSSINDTQKYLSDELLQMDTAVQNMENVDY